MGTKTIQIEIVDTEGRNAYLLRTIQNRLDDFRALREVSVDVFNFHRGVVHQDTHREREIFPAS